jgi:uncharacterized RmlC-like cupin family protein
MDVTSTVSMSTNMMYLVVYGAAAGPGPQKEAKTLTADGTDAWHLKLHHTPHDRLSAATAQTPGMQRYEAVSGALTGSEKIWMGETHVGAGLRSADHHHGESETGIYVVSGHPVFVFLEDDEEVRIETEPGDYVFVPPWVPHREENPSPDTEAVVVIARSSQDAIVVNLPSLRG